MTTKTEPTELETIEMLEQTPTERLLREYLHRVIRRGHEAPNDYAAVISLLDEFGKSQVTPTDSDPRATLSYRERHICRMKDEGVSPSVLAERFKISPERVAQIEAQARQKLALERCACGHHRPDSAWGHAAGCPFRDHPQEPSSEQRFQSLQAAVQAEVERLNERAKGWRAAQVASKWPEDAERSALRASESEGDARRLEALLQEENT